MIDYERLKRDLLEEIGPMMFMNEAAFAEYLSIDSKYITEEELEEKAKEFGYDLEDYEIGNSRRRTIW